MLLQKGILLGVLSQIARENPEEFAELVEKVKA